MANYYVHLGYDWNSYQRGTVWGTAPDSNYWLQYCLTSDSAGTRPALFQFHPGDQLYFQIWDMTIWPSGTLLSQISLSGGIGVNATEGNTIYNSRSNIVDPGTSSTTNLAWTTNLKGQSVIQFLNLSLSQPSPSPWSPWGQCKFIGNTVLGPLKISTTSNMNFEINFQLQVGYSTNGIDPPTNRVFIADPETRIGSGRPL